ncbi:MAG: hypothetical protein AAGU05_04880 [Anaerolineaceae bacterium]
MKVQDENYQGEETMPVQIQSEPAVFTSAGNPPQPMPGAGNSGQGGQTGDGLPEPTEPRSRKQGWLFILGGLLMIVLLGGVGSWLGYQSGLKLRLNNEFDQVAMTAVTQYQLGVEDENAGRLDMARKRYEYVVQLDPNFPGIQDRLAAVMLHQAETNVPTIAPTQTSVPVTPTPDLRGIEEKYNAAAAYMRANDWENAIQTLEMIRKEDIHYRTADVDGMFYIALRFRGIQKISSGNLELGIYDLTLSELFAPLDNSAVGYRNWARFYITGASFWGVDWGKVVEMFGDVYPSMPNMIDSSGYTASERYRIATQKYAEQLVNEGKYCQAGEYFQISLSIGYNEQTADAAAKAQQLCEGPKETDAPTPEVTEPVATEVIPTDPPPAETVVPTETPGG